ncbi:dTDP-glucose 4,6-dehydratase [Ichthyobacterium seriolicida]|uniref:dTDP-glucose 4,6-dehydratase n=1 Tax=Ichthyobacterium seriolicida TaxID=242600 RepID=A0A1J1E6Q5_9FLAO|nr:dTDP-glucose 4,6-dehydratase [Ichthyobacterium seriolicida]BAV95022.1 dTDP-glucose 4,6-dehydratase [Ichthyobacterium seriolicida]
MIKKILITGGAGFIGSHLVKLLVGKYPDYHIINLDALKYSGNLENLNSIKDCQNYTFLKADIVNKKEITDIFHKYLPDGIIHLAAESHVDRSISNPMEFIETNIIGTVNLLNSFKEIHKNNFEGKLFYHISTDEVYGSLDSTGLFTEESLYSPNSPYSASKASSDHFVRAYGATYDVPYIISNCSNNYGPYQFPEKLIPLFINNIKNRKPLPLYGSGDNIRDWLFVNDHVRAIDLIFHKGRVGDSYNVGGFNEWKNIDLVKLLCNKMDEKLGNKKGSSESLITCVKDRAGHDKRYAIDSTKLNRELKWSPSVKLDEGISITIDWYLENTEWLDNVISLEYRKYYQNQYKDILK